MVIGPRKLRLKLACHSIHIFGHQEAFIIWGLSYLRGAGWLVCSQANQLCHSLHFKKSIRNWKTTVVQVNFWPKAFAIFYFYFRENWLWGWLEFQSGGIGVTNFRTVAWGERVYNKFLNTKSTHGRSTVYVHEVVWSRTVVRGVRA